LTLSAILLLIIIVAGVLWLRHPGLNYDTSGRASSIFSVANKSGTTYLTVTGDGKVGIGTDNPASPLDVEGAVRIGESGEGGGPLTAGEIAYNPANHHFWGCDGSDWRQLDN